MKQRSLRLLGSSLLIGLAACANTAEVGPPFGLSHPDHPEGWRRADLEHDDKDVVMWRIVLPRETKPPKGSGLRSESFKTLIDQGSKERLGLAATLHFCWRGENPSCALIFAPQDPSMPQSTPGGKTLLPERLAPPLQSCGGWSGNRLPRNYPPIWNRCFSAPMAR